MRIENNLLKWDSYINLCLEAFPGFFSSRADLRFEGDRNIFIRGRNALKNSERLCPDKKQKRPKKGGGGVKNHTITKERPVFASAPMPPPLRVFFLTGE